MKLYKTKISLLAILTILCVFALALTLVTDANTVVRAEGEVAQPTIAA